MDYESLYSTATKALNTQLEINEQQAERIKELTEELDAECRVSQMLLANRKKQDKQIKELENKLTEPS